MISFGVCKGANIAYQPRISKPGTVSAMGGTPGAIAVRVSVVTPSERIRPVFSKVGSDGTAWQDSCTCPPITSVIEGTAPR